MSGRKCKGIDTHSNTHGFAYDHMQILRGGRGYC